MITPMLAACAAFVAPQTLDAVVQVESGYNYLAINVNGLPAGQQPTRQKTIADAVATAKKWIAKGYSVDLGLMQINSRNLTGLHVGIEHIFEPCTNIRAGAEILADDYGKALKKTNNTQQALSIALSYYNTGTPDRGFHNGYVARYYINISPHIVVAWGKNNDVGKIPGNPNPYNSETEMEIPSSYFQQVNAKVEDKK